jgi:hypothetical protein
MSNDSSVAPIDQAAGSFMAAAANGACGTVDDVLVRREAEFLV